MVLVQMYITINKAITINLNIMDQTNIIIQSAKYKHQKQALSLLLFLPIFLYLIYIIVPIFTRRSRHSHASSNSYNFTSSMPSCHTTSSILFIQSQFFHGLQETSTPVRWQASSSGARQISSKPSIKFV